MNEILEMGKKTLSIFGMKLDMFPGIPIALIPLYFIIDHYKESLLLYINADQFDESTQTSILFILLIILGISLWKLSSYFLDPIYDNFWPAKRMKGSYLDMYIKRSREIWSSRDAIYKSQNVSIYNDTLHELKQKDSKIYNDIKLSLSASKYFRILVLPTFALAISKLIASDMIIGIIFLGLSFLFVAISFSYRAEQSRNFYNWFIRNTKT